jgi:hypothetical protein
MPASSRLSTLLAWTGGCCASYWSAGATSENFTFQPDDNAYETLIGGAESAVGGSARSLQDWYMQALSSKALINSPHIPSRFSVLQCAFVE